MKFELRFQGSSCISDTVIFVVDRTYTFWVKIILHPQGKLKFTLIWFIFKMIKDERNVTLTFILPV